MKILLIHSDELKFEAKSKAMKDAKELSPDLKKNDIKDSLVVFWAGEEGDESNPESVISNTEKEIRSVAKQVGAKKVVLYPYVHLLFGSKPSSSLSAQKIAEGSKKSLENDFEVFQAPFGYYKSFELKCKGHPLSELSRVITAECGAKDEKKDESQALKEEKTLKSQWMILDLDGNLTPAENYDFKGKDNLRKFKDYEISKVRSVDRVPPHITYMKKLELVDYEAGSDPGNLRFYPKGRMIKALLETYVTNKILKYGGVEVETPIMYDFEHPSLKKYLNRFPARQYTIESDQRKFFLRFAACFGQFLMAHDATLSYKNLPLKLYEMTRYSFRKEQSGELVGLRRLRAFTMPDVHALCTGFEQAMEEYKKRFQLCLDVQKGIGLNQNDFELAVRVTKDFYKEHKDFVQFLVNSFGKPALIEMWEERKFYFVLKYEFNFVDNLDKASALSTDQIDVENSITYDLNFTDSDGKKKHPIILHCSPSGAIERVMYALLEKAGYAEKAGKPPRLPLWLSPTQIRILPVGENYLKNAEELSIQLEKENIRVDIDDNEETVGKKISRAEQEWVPLQIVFGEKEANSKTLPVRFRETGKIENMSIQEIKDYMKKETEDKPFRPIPLSKMLSKRPKFVG